MRRYPIAALLVLTMVAGACGGTPPADVRAESGVASEGEPDSGRERATKRVASEVNEAGKTQGSRSSAKERTAGQKASVQTGARASGSDEQASARKQTDAAPRRQAAPVAIPAGEHGYATEGTRTVSGNRQEMPETTTLTTERPTGEVQRQIRDLRDADGHGTVTETHLVYRASGVHLSYVKVTSSFPGGFTDVREFSLPEPELIAPTDGGPGFEHSFSMEGSGTRADVRITALRYEPVEIDGSVLRTLIVETDIRFSGALEGEQRSVAWYWSKHLWALREQVDTDVRNGPIRLQSRYQARLSRLPR